jgi:hypothetical protein
LLCISLLVEDQSHKYGTIHTPSYLEHSEGEREERSSLLATFETQIEVRLPKPPIDQRVEEIEQTLSPARFTGLNCQCAISHTTRNPDWSRREPPKYSARLTPNILCAWLVGLLQAFVASMAALNRRDMWMDSVSITGNMQGGRPWEELS